MQACPTKHVLFLDDDREFLETIESLLPQNLRETWSVHRTDDPAYALVLLREHPMDLVVTDLSMPLLDGLQFLQLLQRVCPQPRKVVLTSVPDPDFRQACLSNGAELYIVKPSSLVAFESTLNLFKELLEWPVEPGFSGMLRRVQIGDVLQLECLAHASSILDIRSPLARGMIYIREGHVIHAELGTLEGEEAFMQLVNLGSGQFEVLAFTEPVARTIQESCHSLLLGAAQRRDEAGYGSPDPVPAAENPLTSISSMLGGPWRADCPA